MTRSRLGLALPVAVILTWAHAATGTNRYYADVVAMSADGKLRLEAKSPDNADGKRRPFAKDFVYVLSESASGRPVWDRKQGREGPPVAAFVHNGGWVAVWTGYNQLLILDPRGVVLLDLNILRDGLPAAEVKEFVHETTAGPLWSYYSHWYFFSAGGRPYFAVRTWWDRRIVVSLTDGKTVADEKTVRQAANAAEREFALKTLRAGVELARKRAAMKLPEYSSVDRASWDDVRDLGTAIHLAGRTRLQEAGPLLRELEPIPCFDGSVTASETVPAGGLYLACNRSDSTRRQVQLALRRLGEKPAGYPVREVMRCRTDAHGEEPYHPTRKSNPRATRVADVTKEMKPQAVVDAIGEPDYVTRPAERDGEADWVWEYDLDADKPFTLRVVWKGQQIRAIEKIDPPAWKGNTRDLEH